MREYIDYYFLDIPVRVILIKLTEVRNPPYKRVGPFTVLES